MTTKTCDTCGEDKPLSEFAKAGRGRRSTCEPCRVPPAEEETATPDGPSIAMEPGFGFRAAVHDGHLRIDQTDSEGNVDTIMLSPTEAKVLFAHFAEWAK